MSPSQGGAGKPWVAVVGAGIAGLAAANALHRGGCRVTVVDKGKNPGGRMSRKRSPSDPTTGWDHGAQYFTARDPEFVRQVADWQRGGVVDAWHGRFVVSSRAGVTQEPEEARWVGKPAMNAPLRDLAARLLHGSVRCECRVEKVVRDGDRFALQIVPESKGMELAEARFDAVLVTAPAPQAADLLAAEPLLQERLGSVRMLPCVALMLGFDAPLDIAWDAARVEQDPVLAWVARDGAKPGRARGERWVLHATPAWSDAHFADEATSAELLSAFATLSGSRAVPGLVVRHGWRFARVEQPLDVPFLAAADGRLAFAGDACLGARVEEAWRSGSAAGTQLAARLRS